MLFQDSAREWFDLAESDGFKSPGPFETEGEAANTTEEIENGKFLGHVRP